MSEGLQIYLRQERNGNDSRYLSAYLDDLGNLHVDGQTSAWNGPVSADGDASFKAIRAEDVPKVVALLGRRTWRSRTRPAGGSLYGEGSYELEKVLQESEIEIAFPIAANPSSLRLLSYRTSPPSPAAEVHRYGTLKCVRNRTRCCLLDDLKEALAQSPVSNQNVIVASCSNGR